jgi:hypothetical protein
MLALLRQQPMRILSTTSIGSTRAGLRPDQAQASCARPNADRRG